MLSGRVSDRAVKAWCEQLSPEHIRAEETGRQGQESWLCPGRWTEGKWLGPRGGQKLCLEPAAESGVALPACASGTLAPGTAVPTLRLDLQGKPD